MRDIDGPGGLGTSFAGRFAVGQVVFMGGVPAGMEITEMISLVMGTTYTISFNASATRDDPIFPNAEGGIFSLIVNSAAQTTVSSGSTSTTMPHYHFLSANYTATSTGPHSIGARITRPFTPGGFELYQHVDNFVITPEPGTLAALGFGALALMRRRKK